MKRNRFFYNILLVFGLTITLTLGGCSLFQGKKAAPQQMKQPVAVSKSAATRAKYQKRPRISTNRNKYEGSLWRDESSFGNLLRDHRARFRHDLLTITDLAEVITVPPPKEEAAQEAETDIQKANVALEALNLRDTLEEEQNDILRSLDTISAEVVRVLPNGNMVIRGRKIDHRQRNQVRYVTTVQGILRPADVTDSNMVPATKLVYPEVKSKRQILGSLLRTRLNRLAPLLGKQQAGLLERLSDFSKVPKK